MPATNIKLSHIEDTTTNITAGKRRNMFAFDTTKDVAIYYKNDGSTIRNFVMTDSSNNVIQTINNVTVGGVLTGSGTINLSGTVNANAIYHLAGSDTDTNITFADDDILLTAGGVEFLQATEAAQDVLLINPGSVDIDFIVNANGAESLRVDGATGCLGVGTATPDCILHVHKATAGTVTAQTYSVITGENNDNCMFSLLSPNNKYSGFFFGDPDDNDIGRLLYDHSTNSMKFYTSATLAMEIGATQGIELTGAASTMMDVRFYSTTDASPSVLRLTKSSSGSVGTLAQTVASEALGSLHFAGVNASTAIASAATIEAVQVDAAGANYVGASLLFKTGSNSGAPATRMTLGADASLTLTGALVNAKGQYHYIGAPAAQHSWRFGSAAGANDLIVEYAATAGVWTEKFRVTI